MMVWKRRELVTIIPVVGIIYNSIRLQQMPENAYKSPVILDCMQSAIAIIALGIICMMFGV